MNAAQEFDDRATREAEKAVEKYGEDAALETGHPDKDVLDYAVNELVGLVRYGEMIEARLNMFDQPGNPRIIGYLRRGIKLAREIQETARDQGERLIALRQGLQANELYLGESENR